MFVRPELSSLQRWFFAQLQPGARRTSGAVLSTAGLPAKVRVGIYADMYLARLQEALAAEFPRLQAAMGVRSFAMLARRYLARYPSIRPTIQHLGERLPRYLAAQRRQGRLARWPYAKDLARLELVASEVFVAPGVGEEPLWTADDLRAVAPSAWPGLIFQATPTLRVLKLGYRFAPGGVHGERSPRPQRKPTRMRVWRRGLEVYESPMTPIEQRALEALVAGRSFAEVCLVAKDAPTAASLLATWVEAGLLVRPSAPLARPRRPRQASSRARPRAI